MVLKVWVANENWLQVMNITSFNSLSENVHFWANRSISNLRELSLAIECEASEFLNVHTASSLKVLMNILNE